MLLFHDKETGANKEFAALERELNDRYFNGRMVVKVRNKPSL